MSTAIAQRAPTIVPRANVSIDLRQSRRRSEPVFALSLAKALGLKAEIVLPTSTDEKKSSQKEVIARLKSHFPEALFHFGAPGDSDYHVSMDDGDLERRDRTIVVPGRNKVFDEHGKKRILVPLGDNEAGLNALEEALHIAGLTQSEICLFHSSWHKKDIASSDAWEHLTPDMRQNIHRAILRCEETNTAYRVCIETDKVIPDLAEGIVLAAYAMDCHVIVMAHGRKKFRGNNIAKVARRCPLPLIIAKNTPPRTETTKLEKGQEAPKNRFHFTSPQNREINYPWYLSPFLVMGLVVLMYIVKAYTKWHTGTLAHAESMIADGLHNLSDIVQAGIVIVIAYLRRLPVSKLYRFGHQGNGGTATLVAGITLAIVGLLPLAYHSTIGLLIIIPACAAMLQAWCAKLPLLPYPKTLDVSRTFMPQALFTTGLSIILSVLFGRFQIFAGKRTGDDAEVADGIETLSDGWIEFVTFCGLVGAYLFGAPWLEHVAGLILCIKIFGTVRELIEKGYALINQKALYQEDAIETAIKTTLGVAHIEKLATFLIGSTPVCLVDIRLACESTQTNLLVRALRHRINQILAANEEWKGSNVHIEIVKEKHSTTRVAFPLKSLDTFELSARLSEATVLMIGEERGDGRVTDLVQFSPRHPDILGLLAEKRVQRLVAFHTDQRENARFASAGIERKLSATPFLGEYLLLA